MDGFSKMLAINTSGPCILRRVAQYKQPMVDDLSPRDLASRISRGKYRTSDLDERTRRCNATMEAGFDLSPEMRQWVSPSLIEANYILSLSQQELQNVIEQELLANPALELDDRSVCPACGTMLEGPWCPTCRTEPSPSLESTSQEYDESETRISSVATEADDEFDPLSIVATRVDPRETILSDARTVLDPEEHRIAAYLIDAFDDRGFVNDDLSQLSQELGSTVEHVEEVLEVIQDISPIGVGSRSLAECLHLQTRYLEATGEDVPPHVGYLIDHHLDDLGAHKFGKLARQLVVSVDVIEAARDFIRDRLNPHPLQNQQARSWGSPTDSPLVSPDVIIKIDNGDVLVEVIDSRYNYLRLNGMYSELLARIAPKNGDKQADKSSERERPTDTDEPLSGDDRDHVRQFANRARLFISNIDQRCQTLLKISRSVCEFQEEFLRGGVRDLKPLTRAVVAQQVGVHESTVSRATANKFVMLPSHKVIPYSDFFRPSLSTKDVIKEIIEGGEAQGHAITDREICDILLDDGIRIARRTVAKYRAELGILPSTMR